MAALQGELEAAHHQQRQAEAAAAEQRREWEAALDEERAAVEALQAQVRRGRVSVWGWRWVDCVQDCATERL